MCMYTISFNLKLTYLSCYKEFSEFLVLQPWTLAYFILNSSFDVLFLFKQILLAVSCGYLH